MIKKISFTALVLFTCHYLLAIFNSLFTKAGRIGPYSNMGITDALEYWSAYKIWSEGGNPLSAIELLKLQQTIIDLKEPIIMWNPPWTLAILSPLLQIQDFFYFARYWAIASIIIYVLSCWLILSTFAKQYRSSHDLWIILMSFSPLLSVLYWGQISAWLLLGLSLALTGISKKNWLLCSAGWLLMSFKFHLFLTLIPLLGIYSFKFKNNNTYLIKSFIGFLSVILLFYLLNAELSHEWLRYTLGLKTPEIGTATRQWITSTVPSLIRHISGLEFNYIFLSLTIIFLSFLIAQYLVKVSSRNLANSMILIVCLSFPTGAFAWFYDYVCLVPALIISWPYILKNDHLKYFYIFSVVCLLYFSRALTTALDALFIVLPLTAYLSIGLLNAIKSIGHKNSN